MRYDIESLLAGVEELIRANLNTKIAEIEAEKTVQGSPVGLPGIADEAYFEQSWNDEILNYSPAIFFGVEEIQATGAGPETMQVVKLFVEVLFTDAGNDKLGKKRVHRYSRALKEVFEERYAELGVVQGKIKIETVRPISFKLDLDNADEIRVGGVSIITAII